MPLSTTAPAAAFAAARDAAVVSPLPGLAFLDVAGADAIAFLHGQLSNDVAGLAPGTAEWATYNSPKGRMLATMLVWRPATGPACRLALAADLAEPIRKRLSMFVLRSKVTLATSAPALSAVGIGGPAAARAVRAALAVDPVPMREVPFDGGGAAIGLPDGRVLVAVPADRAESTVAALAKHATVADESIWRWLAIRAGVAQITLALQERHVPQTANWEVVGGVSFAKGCYPGQEPVARLHHRGHPNRTLRVLAIEGDELPPYDAELALDGKVVGRVTSAARDPGHGIVALAYVRREVPADATVVLADGRCVRPVDPASRASGRPSR